MKFKKTISGVFFAAALLLCVLFFAAPAAQAAATANVDSQSRVYTLTSDGAAFVTQKIVMHYDAPVTSASFYLACFSSPPDDFSVELNGHKLVNRRAAGFDRSTDLYNYKGTASSGYSVNCRFPQETQDVTIECSFTLPDVVTVYKDAAILRTWLIGYTDYNVTSAELSLILPEKTDAKQIDVFWDDYHFKPDAISDGEAVTVTLTDVEKGTDLMIYAALPTELFPDALNAIRRQSDALPDLAKTRDRDLTYIHYREWFSARENRIVIVSLVAACFLGYVTRIRRRRYRPISVAPGKGTLPKELSPMQFSILMNFYRRTSKKKRTRNALYGALISLVDRGLVSVYATDDVNDCILSYTPWEGCETTGDENILLLLLFEDIGGGESEITLSQIREYVKLFPGVVNAAIRHMSDYAISEMAQEHNIEFFRFVKLPLDIFFQIAFLVMAALMALLQCWRAALVMLLCVFIISIFGRDRLHRLSRSGEDLYARGEAFRRFVVSCGNGEQEGTLPEIAWWSNAMGYAAALGLAPYLHRTLPELYPELRSETFAADREGSAPLWGNCAVESLGNLATVLWRLTGVLYGSQRVVARSDDEK